MKDEWEELIRAELCLYNTVVPFHAIFNSNDFIGGPKYRKLLFYVKEEIGYYYENFADHHRVGKFVLDLFLKDKDILDKFLKYWMEQFKKLNELMIKTKSTDLSSLSDQELANLLEEVYKTSIFWHGVAYNVDAIDTVLNPIIEGVIKKTYPNERKSKLSEIYNKLTFPEVLSYTNRMDLEKLELMKELKDKFNEDKIKKFVKKYYWIKYKWGESEDYTEKEFMDEFKEKELNQIESEINNIKTMVAKSLDEKHKFIDKISKQDEKIKIYMRIFDEYAVLHDLRKEGQVKAVYSIRIIHQKFAKRKNIPGKLIYYLWPMEIVNSIRENKNFDLDLMKKRSKEFFCELYDDGTSKEYYGKEAGEKRSIAIELDKMQYKKEFQGLSASQGRIIGTAKICLGDKEANEKISKGDILVTGMTMPEFVPAMKKSAAIVTDEGGLTCHAAIIARELGIPCIVGTKIATRTLKDGDKIEVNANHGVIKILG